jgi:Holliday junction resolvasome RuvABC endonuclease subunit
MAFREWLTATAREAGGIQAVYFEDVKNHAGVIASHVYGGYLAMLEAWCAANNIAIYGVSVGTIKKHWTGKGNAKKEAMVAEAERRGYRVVDDNQADALAILAYGINEERA